MIIVMLVFAIGQSYLSTPIYPCLIKYLQEKDANLTSLKIDAIVSLKWMFYSIGAIVALSFNILVDYYFEMKYTLFILTGL